MQNKLLLDEYRDIKGRNPFDIATKHQIKQKYRSFHRKLNAPFHSWISSLALSAECCPIHLSSSVFDCDLRMISLGVVSTTSSALSIFDVERAEVIRSIDTNRAGVSITCISLSTPPLRSKISPMLAVGLYNGVVRLYDVLTGLQVYEKISSFNHGTAISSVYLYEGASLVLIVSAGSNIHVWDVEYMRVVSNLKLDHEITAIRVLDDVGYEDGNRINRSYLIAVDIRGNITYRDLETLSPIQIVQGHEGQINALEIYSNTLSSDVITAGNDSYIKLWNINDETHTCKVFSGHEGPVHAMTVLSGTHIPLLFSGGHDCIIRIWNIITGDAITNLSVHKGMIKALACTSSPRMQLVSGGQDNITILWDLELSEDPALNEIISNRKL